MEFCVLKIIYLIIKIFLIDQKKILFLKQKFSYDFWINLYIRRNLKINPLYKKRKNGKIKKKLIIRNYKINEIKKLNINY